MVAVQVVKDGYVATLIACGKRKKAKKTFARDLYTGQMFVSARAVAEREGRPWYILSAKHRLLNPGKKIGPYDEALKMMTKAERETWSMVTAKMIRDAIPPGRILVLAGKKYWEGLVRRLPRHELVTPLKGKMGYQLSWLKKRVR